MNKLLRSSGLGDALAKTPAHMTFRVTSSEQQDITGFLNDVRSLIRENNSCSGMRTGFSAQA